MRKLKLINSLNFLLLLLSYGVFAGEYHVSVDGSDDGKGSMENPFKTIMAAVNVARAGDTIIIHEGTYREWVNPLFGGTSHLNRVVYQAAEGERVTIKGSEVIKGWEKVTKGVWKVTLDNEMFGEYNPYQDIIEADWFRDFGRDHHTGEVYLNGKSFYEIDTKEKVMNPESLEGAQDQDGSRYQWYCESNSQTTTLWANFHDYDPNEELVEINVRPVVFFPRKTGIDYITVKGFTLTQAATTWAPPTVEQIGLIGPNWSKGWIIENNTITHSKCTGISLGKDRSTGHNYSLNYKKKNGHISQLESVFSAIKNGWSRENVGSHLVRNNVISNCEQTGICGNMGSIFSKIEGNHIYDIYVKRQWGGFEMGGIKLHVPIDVQIIDNCIHNVFKGMWIDWQAQGIRISGNLLYDNSWMDLHVEVSHGPHIIDNNLFLSDLNLWNMATGSAYINNLFAGQICEGGESERFTPYHYPHSTKVAGIMTLMSGDDHYINNIFIKTPTPSNDIFENARRPKRAEESMGFGLSMYDDYPAERPEKYFFIGEMSNVKLPVKAENNLYLNGAEPYKNGVNNVIKDDSDLKVTIENKIDGIYLELLTDNPVDRVKGEIINSFSFGEAMVPGLIFDHSDGTLIFFARDYFHKQRTMESSVGPFSEFLLINEMVKLWPK